MGRKIILEGHSSSGVIDEAGKPAKFSILPSEEGPIYLSFCLKHDSNYGDSEYCCSDCIVMKFHEQESLINLYNTLHEALMERNLE